MDIRYIQTGFKITIKLLPDEIQDSVSEQVPVLAEGEVPEFGQHLNQGRLPHPSLPLDDHRDTALCPLVDVEHLDGKVQCQDILGVVNSAQTGLLLVAHLQGDVQSP